MNQQLLDLRGGDFEEHFFTYLDEFYQKSSYIKIGVPEGKTIYVLRRNLRSNEVEIWNACLGEPYYYGTKEYVTKFLCMTISRGLRSEINEYETFCPLQEIGMH